MASGTRGDGAEVVSLSLSLAILGLGYLNFLILSQPLAFETFWKLNVSGISTFLNLIG